ncbi:type III-B CRISPR module RAMP protein Cmr6 [Anaerorudis cellulosivorans]|uniref:type III-B CRISPR module RAMP protein Cmr6 n=1 Tax=Anaerorudis cellulosivorans TaxID=3397862 RepID=UPI00221F2C11|nr:type III-B CRISPR module RAMP protein Cmr6 [Seramator thermalis]MCW1735720.1 type III-B CRISPR module RAMP protein Cmr6 [Seramator thermalis]
MPTVIEKYKNANLGWFYYKHYFKSPDAEDILANRNETIVKSLINNSEQYFDIPQETVSFCLKTIYPGLLIGSGYTHEAIFNNKEEKEEAIKIGFFFDHTTGMPYIPGHSVKGVLRNAFPNHKNEKFVEEKTETIIDYLGKKDDELMVFFKEYLSSKFKNDNQDDAPSFSHKLFVELLGNIIFEGKEPCAFNKKTNSLEYRQIPIYKRDIFYDAYFYEGNRNREFLGTDYITPHPNPLKNPNPIKFLKILPNVKIKFQFDLKDNLISKELKKELFKKILLDFGIGAKTNVGYGKFTEV